jgi:hypothetical protein
MKIWRGVFKGMLGNCIRDVLGMMRRYYNFD